MPDFTHGIGIIAITITKEESHREDGSKGVSSMLMPL